MNMTGYKIPMVVPGLSPFGRLCPLLDTGLKPATTV